MDNRTPSTLRRGESLTDQRPIERFFAQMTAILGGPAVERVFGDADPDLVKEEWSAGMSVLLPAELERGLDGLRTRQFCPNLGEFLRMCRPALDPEVAWHEAARGFRAFRDGRRFAWSHHAVYWCGRDFAFELMSRSYGDVRKRWDLRLVEWFAAGSYGEIPDPTAKRLDDKPSQASFSSEFTQEHRADLLRKRDAIIGRISRITKTIVPAAREVMPGSTEDAERTAALKLEQTRKYRAWLVSKGLACDGEHGGRPCDDPECWQR